MMIFLQLNNITWELGEGQSSYELNIKKFAGFPKGATSLQAALIDSESGKVWVSPIGHWDIKGAPRGALDGFAAVDKRGKVLDYYTREEAGRLVDPNRQVIDPDSGALTNEDIRHSQFEGEPKKKKSLTEADRQYLAGRKEARGGKTIVQEYKEARAKNKKIKERVARSQNGPSRWDKLNPTKDLRHMKPNTLEIEASRVRGVIKDDLKRGLQPIHGKVRYHESRLQAIELLQKSQAQIELQKQRVVAEKLAQKAGDTEKSKIRFFKAEYKRLIRLDAPYSSVQFTKNKLIDLLGPDIFYKFSGETAPTLPKTAKQKLVKKDKVKQVGPVKVKKVKEFTEQDAKDRAKVGDERVAGSPEEARTKLDTVMTFVRNTYIRKGKIMPKKYADQVVLVLQQAQAFKIVDEAEFSQLSDELTYALTGADVSYESQDTIHRDDKTAKDPIQKIFNKYSPREVKFDAYYAPSDGYVPSGYSFTITDRHSPAYGRSFAIENIDKATITKKIKEAEDLQIKESTFEFEVTMDGEGITKARSNFGPDSRILIEFDHRFLHSGNIQQTTISFLLEEKGVTPTYERYNFYNNVIKDKAKKGIQTIRTIQRMLFDLMNNQYNAKVPSQIVFQGSTYDKKKNKTYRGFAERLAKYLGWKLKIKKDKDGEPYFIISNPKIKKIYVEDKNLYRTNELTSDDMPDYDPLVQYETQNINKDPFRFKDDKMNRDADRDEGGVIEPGYFSKFLKYIREDFKTHFREFKYLPRKIYSDVQYQLRQLKKSQTLSMSKVAKLLAKNIDTLSKVEYNLLTKVSYMMDFYEQVKMNQELRAAGEKVKVEKFPNGYLPRHHAFGKKYKPTLRYFVLGIIVLTCGVLYVQNILKL